MFIENDVPAAQRAINANFRTLFNALAESNLQLKGSRISIRQYGQEQYASHNRDESSYRQSGRDNYEYYRSHERRDNFESDRRERSHGSYGNNRTMNSRRDDRYNYCYKCGFWNVRGWKPDIYSDNHKLRSECLMLYNLDITGIAETHLFDAQNLALPEYTWYGQNRKKTCQSEKGFWWYRILCEK